MIIPEQKLKKIIDYVMGVVTKEYLYTLFGDENLNDYNYYENAVEIFLKRIDNPRKIETHIFFNRDRSNLPTIHIGMPSESTGIGNGIGFDPEDSIDCNNVLQENFSRMYNARYNIIFTSNNTFEVLIMYHTFKAIFQGNSFLLEQNGFINPSIYGQDIILNEYLVPVDIYSRALILDCVYESISPRLELTDVVSNFGFSSNCGK